MTTETSQPYQERFFAARDGLRLHARDYRPAIRDDRQDNTAGDTRAPVVCLPGLSRNARDFHQFACAIADEPGRRVVALDYRGRGRSEEDANKANYTLAVECTDVETALDALGIESAVFVGTSRGGLILHLLAAAAPHRLKGVVLNDIGPVIEPKGLQEIAAYLNRPQAPGNWEEATVILRGTHSAAFPALSQADWQDMAQAIYVERGGAIVADFDPAIARQLLAADLTKPLPDLWAQFDAFRPFPVLAIRGEHSSLLSPETLAAMARRHPGLATVTARGQGHAPILHKPDVLAAIRDFLRTV
ncbi:alpha/beta hydrolase [Rhizobium sp. TRM96647]|uniref:alpha/beta fold hydrolase n=1 Tax=unclassified Rhizobium TaxID=2613769 RepID=UPI0021E8BAE8|nr:MULTISPECIES: alpha/beta hydrolase [unclassified Rhizobium]MCV3738536.1 alpha/beta hydrolase [Rhizobium sp. TRM96647]MCV3760223.1 alpha/beta hydrolase [Rhizobium sp. TRM96650]